MVSVFQVPFMKTIQLLLGLSIISSMIAPAPCVALTGSDTNFQTGEIILDSSDVEQKVQEEEKGATSQPAVSDKAPLKAGSHLPITIDSHITSKTAHVGDVVTARLSNDLSLGGRLVAPKGSLVQGHVCSVQPGRKVLKAELSRHRWMKSAGELGIQFDEIVTDQDHQHFQLAAVPARQARFVKDMDEGRVLGINDKGEIVSPLSAQVKSQCIHWGVHIAVSAGGAAAGPIGMGAVPVAFGCIGAISPSFAYMHPVGRNVPHRRLKGFALGFISGAPGGGFIVDAIVRGPEAIIEPGDVFEVELKQEFTGEPVVVAQTEEVAASKTVQGEVLPPEEAMTTAK
jgi:hypothetical protein